MKHLRDYLEVNIPNGLTIATVTLADVQAVTAIALGIVSIICTILITRHKLRRDKD